MKKGSIAALLLALTVCLSGCISNGGQDSSSTAGDSSSIYTQSSSTAQSSSSSQSSSSEIQLPAVGTITAVRDDAIYQLQNYVTDFSVYSAQNAQSIQDLVASAVSDLNATTNAEQIINKTYAYQRQIDDIPTLKQQEAQAFVGKMSSVSNSYGNHSVDGLVLHKDGIIEQPNMQNYTAVALGAQTGNPYTAFDTELVVDYDSNTWSTFSVIFRLSGSSEYRLHSKNSVCEVKKDGALMQSIAGIPDNQKVHLQVLCCNQLKLVLIDGVVVAQINESSHLQGAISLTTWQSRYYLSNYSYNEYASEADFMQDYGTQVEAARTALQNKVTAAQNTLSGATLSNANDFSVDTNSGSIVQSNSTSTSSIRLGVQRDNPFTTFKADITPTYNVSNAAFTIYFRMWSELNTYRLTITSSKVQVHKIKTTSQATSETLISETAIGLEAGKKSTLRILCCAQQKTVVINSTVVGYINEGDFNVGYFQIGTNCVSYRMDDVLLDTFDSQEALTAVHPELWQSYWQ